jgi:hypothetical protein
LRAILEQARQEPLIEPVQYADSLDAIATLGDAVEARLGYLRVEKRRKLSTLLDARYVASLTAICFRASARTPRCSGASATR